MTFGARILYGVPEHFAADAHRHLVDVECVPNHVFDSEQCAWIRDSHTSIISDGVKQ